MLVNLKLISINYSKNYYGGKISHIYNMKRRFLNLIIIVSILPLLQGCFVVAGLAALGGGGYYVGTKAGKREEERIKTQALIDVKRELQEKDEVAKAQDQDITNQINQNYLAGALTGGIAVYPEVRNGVVILHGRVPDAQTAERAIAAARKTTGVQRIISNLVILNQPATAQPKMPLPAQVPPQYQQQYNQFLQQYQQAPIPQYPQIQMQQQPMMQAPIQAPQTEQPTRIKYEQIFNYQQKPSKAYAGGVVGKSQIANKQQAKQQKQSPPNNIAKNKTTPTPSHSSSSQKTLPNQTISQYSDDNDSGYKEYRPRKVNAVKPATNITKQKEVVFVPVPVPTYTEDNDNLYRGVGEYNPMPVNPGSPSYQDPSMPQQEIPVPTPSETQDNDFQYYD